VHLLCVARKLQLRQGEKSPLKQKISNVIYSETQKFTSSHFKYLLTNQSAEDIQHYNNDIVHDPNPKNNLRVPPWVQAE